MSVHKKLTRWAKERGVLYTGIRVQVTDGQGTGIIAARAIEPGEIILTVPAQAVHCLDTVDPIIALTLKHHASIQGILAADVMLGKASKYTSWKAVLPSEESLHTSIPMMWPEALQALLPTAAKSLLYKQQDKVRRDWGGVSSAFPGAERNEYLCHWFLVGTRTFYWETPSTKNLSHDDQLALLPVADMFNHADVGCSVAFSAEEGYDITTKRAYQTGEEVYTSYGEHSNDFLLTEYGFVLQDNRWDEVCLDDIIIPALNAETSGCFKTQVALRLLASKSDVWQEFLTSGDRQGPSQSETDALLAQFLNNFSSRIQETLKQIEELGSGQKAQRDLLTRRWKQIGTIVANCEQKLKP
ncbi:hypothetical protein MKZ38_005000 [Zalerion maritima]|uniref:SET domain-containing protein n=1 Tax=Zalerion maritima TaxID=339359 RepID=A0AAD5RL24_9PEZI|nr:hypothetical protein MKZ38_005000 [Zalerion maritima]